MSRRFLIVSVVIGVVVIVVGLAAGIFFGLRLGFGPMGYAIGPRMSHGLMGHGLHDMHRAFADGGIPFFGWGGVLFFWLGRLALWLAQIVLIASLVAWLLRRSTTSQPSQPSNPPQA